MNVMNVMNREIKPTLVVLAAGMGSRYGGLKQVDPVGPNGEVILDYSVYDALRAGFGKVVFVVSEAIEAVFRERIGRAIEAQCEVVYVLQRMSDAPPGFRSPPGREKPWGTGHATLACRDVVNGPFAVINADDFYGRSAFALLADYLARVQHRGGYEYCMVGYVLENTLTEHGSVSRGVCTVGDDGRLVEIHERTRIERFGDVARYAEDEGRWAEIPLDRIVSMNAWGFTPEFFDALESRFVVFLEQRRRDLSKGEYFLPEVVGALIREGMAQVEVLKTDERWFGVTYQEDRARVKQAIERLVQDDQYPGRLWG